MKNKNIIMYIVIILILGGVIALGLYAKKANNKEDNKVKQNTNNQNIENNKQNNSFKESQKNEKQNNNVVENIKDINQQTSTVEAEYNPNIILEKDKNHDFTFEIVDTGKNTVYHYKTNIYYKGNLIKENDKVLTSIYQIDDIALCIFVGTDSSIGTYALDKNGNILKDFIIFDNELIISGKDAWKKNPKVDGNIITFNVAPYGGYQCNTKNQEAIVQATYQIEYLGNNQFSDLKMISSSTRAEVCANGN